LRDKISGLGGTEDASGVFTPRFGELPFADESTDPFVGTLAKSGIRRSPREAGSTFGLDVSPRSDMFDGPLTGLPSAIWISREGMTHFTATHVTTTFSKDLIISHVLTQRFIARLEFNTNDIDPYH
jgi:hypothetical protein